MPRHTMFTWASCSVFFSLAFCSLPWVTIASLYLFAGVAAFELGHWPVPSLNRPSTLMCRCSTMRWPVAVTMVWSVPIVLAAGVVFYGSDPVPERPSRILLTGWAAVLDAAVLDPGRLFCWYVD